MQAPFYPAVIAPHKVSSAQKSVRGNSVTNVSYSQRRLPWR
jgi:hypothetical protein